MQRYRDYFYKSITITTDMIPSLKPHWILLFSILALVHMPANGQSKKKQIVSLNVTIDSLENALSQSKGKILSLEQQMNDNEAKSEKEINSLKAELQELKGNLQELQAQLQQTKEAKGVLENKFNLKMEEHSYEKSNLNNTIEQLRKDKEELKNSTEQLKKKIKILQTALEETSNQLVQIEQQEKKQKASKYNDNILIALNDSVREALFRSEIILKIIPENSLVIASVIYDFDGDNNNDFVIIYQDTLGHDKTEMDDYYWSPMIFSGYFFNKELKTFEEKFHCVDLINAWGSEYGEDIWMSGERDTIIIYHYGMTSEHENERFVFFYDFEDKEFIIQSYVSNAIHRFFTNQFNEPEVTEDFIIDFKKKSIHSFGELTEQVNFAAPTLSSWPNGNWKLLWKLLGREKL